MFEEKKKASAPRYFERLKFPNIVLTPEYWQPIV